MKTRIRRHWPVLIAVAHMCLAVVFGVINPPYEGPDETGHFAYVNHTVETRSLPSVLDQADRALLDQSHQPPLYYVLNAALTGWIDRSDNVAPVPNVFAYDGTNRRGVRFLLRQPDEAFPWRGALLALHAARLVSAILGGVTIYLIALTAQQVFAARPAAAVSMASLAAFNPQVVFTSGMVSNDVMVSLVGAATAWVLVRIALAQGEPNRRLFVLAGLVLGCGVLAKNSSYALVAFGAACLFAVAIWRKWPVRETIMRFALAGAAFALLALPYFASNLIRFGRVIVDRNLANPLLDRPTSVIGEGLGVALRDQWLPQIFVNAFRTLWGGFGWGNVQFPAVIYDALAIFCAMGLLGALAGWRRAESRERASMALFAGLGLAMMALPLYRAVYFQSPSLMPGRYLMPALAAYAGIVSFGWDDLLSRVPVPGLRRAWAAGCALALLSLSIATPIALFGPAYAPVVRQTPPGEPLLTFEDKAQLVSLEAENIALQDREGARQYARVRATWRAMSRSDAQLAFGLSVLGRDDDVLGMTNVFPARGNYPATNWRPGDTWEETYDILVEKPCADLPSLGHINVAVYEAVLQEAGSALPTVKAGRSLLAQDAQGRPATPIVGRFRLGEPSQMAVFWQPALAMLGGIGLRQIVAPQEARAGGAITVMLTYEMWNNNGREARAFVHALDAAGGLIAQDDHAPSGGFYPTDFWRPGECATESFNLRLPANAPGALRLVTGFYDARTQQRFVTGTPNDVVGIGDVRVAPGP